MTASPTPTSAAPPATDTTRLIVLEAGNGRVTLGIPKTEYRLDVATAAALPASALGRRSTGRLVGRALRLHPASAGGRFIEPVDGHPRIVQGSVLAVDAATRGILIDAVVPMWLRTADDQPLEQFALGAMVNCYVESGMRWVPIESTDA